MSDSLDPLRLDDLPSRARAFERDLFRRNLRETAGAVVVVAGAAVLACSVGWPLVRLGCLVLIGAALAIVRILWATGWRATPVGSGADRPARQLIALRSALARQRELLRTSARWYLAPLVAGGLLVWAGGAWAVTRQAAVGIGADATLLAGPALIGAMTVLVRALNLREARRLALDITGLDQLARQLPVE